MSLTHNIAVKNHPLFNERLSLYNTVKLIEQFFNAEFGQKTQLSHVDADHRNAGQTQLAGRPEDRPVPAEHHRKIRLTQLIQLAARLKTVGQNLRPTLGKRQKAVHRLPRVRPT